MKMTRIPSGNDPADPAHPADPDTAAAAGPDQPARRKRHGRRIAALSGLTAAVLLGVTVAASVAVAGPRAGGVTRIHAARLMSATGQPAASGHGETVLITGAGFGPTGAAPPGSSAPEFSGLIVLLHINGNKQAGGVVSLPALAVVPVPGHHRMQLGQALAAGGPALLVQTVEQLTGDSVNNYARIDFEHVAAVVDAVGGVYVNVPDKSVSFHFTFHVGINHLDGIESLYYARQPGLTEAATELRQQNLIRAILRTLASHQLLANPVTMLHVLSAVDSMLSVDSDFTNTEVETLATQLATLSGSDGTFLTAPTQMAGKQLVFTPQISAQLWTAIRYDSIAGFAEEYPATVTPAAVP
jgi:LCP family protein required for cell wall assembly